MSRITRMRVGVALVAGVVALSGVAAAGPLKGPLKPLKYHTTAGLISQEHPSSGGELFLLYFDNLDPSGRTTYLSGSIGTIGSAPFVAVASLLTYDPSVGHSVFLFSGSVDAAGAAPPVPMSGQLNVSYDRLERVHKIAVDGVINGTPFSVPPMVVAI